MATYPTLRDVDSPIEVAGIKGQYNVIALVAIVVLFFLAVILGSTSLNIWLVILLIGGAIYGIIRSLVFISNKFGVYGLMKMRVKYFLPKFIKNNQNVQDLIIRL